MSFTKEQEYYLWEEYVACGNKDEVFTAVRNSSLFPDGVTRAQVRDALSGALPEGLELPEPQICFIDIETAPTIAGVWNYFKTNVNLDAIVDDWYILSFAYAMNDGPVQGVSVYDEEKWADGVYSDDLACLEELREVLNKADVVVAHNGDRFDIPKINSRLLVHKMLPPSPYQKIDTLKVLKRNFQFGSNRLAHIARRLDIEQKGSAGGMETWMRCVKGDKQALEDMLAYNIQDIEVLRELYYELRPWIPSHPNIALMSNRGGACTSCGSQDLVPDEPYRTGVSVYNTWRCKSCGTISRERKSIVDKDVRDNLLVPLAR